MDWYKLCVNEEGKTFYITSGNDNNIFKGFIIKEKYLNTREIYEIEKRYSKNGYIDIKKIEFHKVIVENSGIIKNNLKINET